LTAADRKQELLDFAAELLPSVGVEGLNMAAVAARAGIGKQLVHYHFGSR